MAGKLYLCATPIGNLGDMTPRVVETLQMVDLIAAEDTRNSIKLLNHFDIHTPMTSYHEYNKVEKAVTLINQMNEGKNVALITDAGTPAISDPGEVLVRMCHEAGIVVTSLPGAAACITALTLSGLSTRRFCFEGFLPADKKEKKDILENLKNETRTIILYEAPHRLYKTLQNILKIMGNRKISISREITKKYEEVFRGCVQDAINIYKVIKGEIVIIIESSNKEKEINYDSLLGEVDNLISLGVKPTDAIKEVSKNNEVNKNVLYKLFQGRKK